MKESFSNIVPPPNSRANDGQDDVTDLCYESKTTVAKNPSYVVFGQANSKKDISHQIEVKLTIISFKINKFIDLGYLLTSQKYWITHFPQEKLNSSI